MPFSFSWQTFMHNENLIFQVRLFVYFMQPSGVRPGSLVLNQDRDGRGRSLWTSLGKMGQFLELEVGSRVCEGNAVSKENPIALERERLAEPLLYSIFKEISPSIRIYSTPPYFLLLFHIFHS